MVLQMKINNKEIASSTTVNGRAVYIPADGSPTMFSKKCQPHIVTENSFFDDQEIQGDGTRD